MIFDSLHLFALILGLGLAPAFLLASVLYRRSFKEVLLQWKLTKLVFITIIAFIFNMGLFVMTCFFFAAYLGKLQPLYQPPLPQAYLYQVAIDCLLLLEGTMVFYLGLQNFFTQVITRRGIYLTPFPLTPYVLQKHYIRWDQIKDYYVRSDYPVTQYQFIVQLADESYVKRVLKVPFYILPRFETLLEANLRRQQEMRDQSRSILRRMSRN